MNPIDSMSKFRETLKKSQVGQQRILSQVLGSDDPSKEITPPAAFLLLGQRFSIDAELLGSTVYQGGDEPRPYRMMPSGIRLFFVQLFL